MTDMILASRMEDLKPVADQVKLLVSTPGPTFSGSGAALAGMARIVRRPMRFI